MARTINYLLLGMCTIRGHFKEFTFYKHFETLLRKETKCMPCIITSQIYCSSHYNSLTTLAQMVACLPLVQQVQGLIPGGVVNFNLKIFNLGARKGGDVHFLIAKLYITDLD